MRRERTHPRTLELEKLELKKRLGADQAPDVEGCFRQSGHDRELVAFPVPALAGRPEAQRVPVPPMRSSDVDRANGDLAAHHCRNPLTAF
jgi:hypothetical protein